MALTLVGVVRNIQKQRDGFAIWLVANAILAYVQSHAQVWGMVVCQLVFCLTCFWGWWAWKPRVKDEKVEPFQIPLDPHGYFVMARGCSGDLVEVHANLSREEAAEKLWKMNLSDPLGHFWIEQEGWRPKRVGS